MSSAVHVASDSRVERRIALVGLPRPDEERANPALKFVDSVLWVFKGTTKVKWTTTEPAHADVVFTDGDTDVGLVSTWRDARKLIVILRSKTDDSSDSPYTLEFPFSTLQVLTLLERLDDALESRDLDDASPESTGAAQRNDENDPWAFVDALRTLETLGDSQHWLSAATAAGARIWVRGDGRLYHGARSLARAIRCGGLDLSTLRMDKAEMPPAAVGARQGVELTWFANYHASAQPAPWLKDNAVYQLTAWPDFGSLRPVEPALLSAQLRVVARLDCAPATVATLAHDADVSLEQATRMTNALAGCGFARTVPKATRRQMTVDQGLSLLPGGFKSFFSSMRRHLGLGTER